MLDEAAEVLLRKAKKLIVRAFPDLLAELEAIEGDYLEVPRPAQIHDERGSPVGFHSHVQYLLKQTYRGKRILVWINVTCFPNKAGEAWEVVHCGYHCGPAFDPDDVYFRIDLNQYFGLHFHLPGRGRGEEGHISHELADPPICTDPMVFLKMVKEFIATKSIPLRSK